MMENKTKIALKNKSIFMDYDTFANTRLRDVPVEVFTAFP